MAYHPLASRIDVKKKFGTSFWVEENCRHRASSALDSHKRIEYPEGFSATRLSDSLGEFPITESHYSYGEDRAFAKIIRRIKPGYILTAAIVLGFIIGEIGDSIHLACYFDIGSCPTMTDLLAQQNSMVYSHAYWQLFTSIFVTDYFPDATLNAIAVIVVEFFLPDTFNKTRYFSIFFFSALLGNLLTLAEGPFYASAGASGGIFGIFAATFAYYWTENKRIDIATLVLFLALFFGSVFFVGAVAVNWVAHLGGSIGGFIAGPILYLSLGKDPTKFEVHSRSSKTSEILLAAAVVFMVVGSTIQFLFAIVF